MADFLTVHRGGDGNAATAGDALVQWQLKAAQIVDPFLSALGAIPNHRPPSILARCIAAVPADWS